MRKHNINIKTALAVFAVALSACSSDNDIVDNNSNNQEKPVAGKTMTFHASMDGEGDNATRTYFRGNSTAWAANDNIYILNNASVPEETNRLTGAVFGISSGIGSKEADFEGGPIKANGNNQDDFYAFYPSSSYNTTSGKMTGNIPTVQYATDTTYNQALHFMTAHSTNSTFEFKNVCALLKITLSSSDICRVKVVANPTLVSTSTSGLVKDYDQSFTYTSIAGNFEATVGSNGTATTTSTEAKKTYVELRAAGDEGEATTAISAGTYYMVVLPATISNGFTLLLEKKDGTIYQRINTSITSFVRNKMYNLGSYSCSSLSDFTELTDVVDLDMPSGTLWCTKNSTYIGHSENIGTLLRPKYLYYFGLAGDEAASGDYFSWSDHEVNLASTVNGHFKDDPTTHFSLYAEYDGVYQYDNRYCMPVYAQMFELYNNINQKVTETSGSVTGARFTAATGRNIFFPYAGYYYNGFPHQKNTEGRYWSRTKASNVGDWDGDAFCMDLINGTGNVPAINGDWVDDVNVGRSIRPVATNIKIAPILTE